MNRAQRRQAFQEQQQREMAAAFERQTGQRPGVLGFAPASKPASPPKPPWFLEPEQVRADEVELVRNAVQRRPMTQLEAVAAMSRLGIPATRAGSAFASLVESQELAPFERIGDEPTRWRYAIKSRTDDQRERARAALETKIYGDKPSRAKKPSKRPSSNPTGRLEELEKRRAQALAAVAAKLKAGPKTLGVLYSTLPQFTGSEIATALGRLRGKQEGRATTGPAKIVGYSAGGDEVWSIAKNAKIDAQETEMDRAAATTSAAKATERAAAKAAKQAAKATERAAAQAAKRAAKATERAAAKAAKQAAKATERAAAAAAKRAAKATERAAAAATRKAAKATERAAAAATARATEQAAATAATDPGPTSATPLDPPPRLPGQSWREWRIADLQTFLQWAQGPKARASARAELQRLSAMSDRAHDLEVRAEGRRNAGAEAGRRNKPGEIQIRIYDDRNHAEPIDLLLRNDVVVGAFGSEPERFIGKTLEEATALARYPKRGRAAKAKPSAKTASATPRAKPAKPAKPRATKPRAAAISRAERQRAAAAVVRARCVLRDRLRRARTAAAAVRRAQARIEKLRERHRAAIERRDAERRRERSKMPKRGEWTAAQRAAIACRVGFAGRRVVELSRQLDAAKAQLVKLQAAASSAQRELATADRAHAKARADAGQPRRKPEIPAAVLPAESDDERWLRFIGSQGTRGAVYPLSDEAADAYERLERAGKIVRVKDRTGTAWFYTPTNAPKP